MKNRQLEMVDQHRLRAAVGWLELGSPAEARLELSEIGMPRHPDVLEVDWAICAADQDWEAALRSAETLVEEFPERSSGWIHRAYALRRVEGGGLEAAFALLLSAYDAFPEESIISYNLACYTAQFGRLDDSWKWLQTAIDTSSDLAAIKKMALADEDLAPLWERIRKLEIV